MRRFLALVLACIGLSAGAAYAGTIEASFNNTLSATDAHGGVTRYFFNADHTFAMTTPDGARVSGTWRADSAQACLTPAGGHESCNAFEANHVLGDTWRVAMADGAQLTVAITPGR